ncbi:MAG: hypothetical protein R2713_09100 [Ilumatobacteraceae bacterium]
MCGLCRHLSTRRDRVRARGGQVQALPPSRKNSASTTASTARRAAPPAPGRAWRCAWEPAADMHPFGKVREPNDMSGIWRQLLLTCAK